jgi:hypothetical protein
MNISADHQGASHSGIQRGGGQDPCCADARAEEVPGNVELS